MARAVQPRFRRKLATTAAVISSTAASHKAKCEPTKWIVDARARRQLSDRPETPKNCGRSADLSKKSHDRRRFPRDERQPHRGLRFPKSLRARSVAGEEFAILAIHVVAGLFARNGRLRRRLSRADAGRIRCSRRGPG